MSSYETFAQVYDLFMNDVPYDDWVCYIENIWSKYSLKPELVLDLACGTGNVTQRLAAKGYDMIGIDLSEEMLNEAVHKNQYDNVLYLNQDMCEFELYGTVDSIICLCDSINYITEKEDLLQVFKLVNNYLNPKGLFIFDINTVYKFQYVLADNSYSQTTENAAYTWENFYDKDECINEYYTNFFIQNDTGSYDRFEEYHYERGYTVDEIKILLEQAGLILLDVYAENSFDKPQADSQRIYFVAQENGKEEKIDG